MSYLGRRQLVVLAMLGIVALLVGGISFASGRGRAKLDRRRVAPGTPACVAAGDHPFHCAGAVKNWRRHPTAPGPSAGGRTGEPETPQRSPGSPTPETPLPKPPTPTPPTPTPPKPVPPKPPAPEPPTPPAPEPPTPAAPPVFDGAFETGLPGWHLQSLSSRVSLNASAPGEGLSARFEVRPGDVEPETGSARSEVSGPTFEEGEDIYVRDSIRIPASYTFDGSWQLIDQLHEDEWSGSPGFAIFLDDERRISAGAGDGSPSYWRGPELETGRWYELVYRVNLSRSAAEGFVEVWLDGVQQQLENGALRQLGQTIQTSATYLKVGIYRAEAAQGVSVVEHADVAVGESLASVQPVN